MDLVFTRLGSFLENEESALQVIARILCEPGIGRCLRAINMLHRDGVSDDEATLQSAHNVLCELREVLLDASLLSFFPDPDKELRSSLPGDLDARIRYLGARVDDEITAISRVIHIN